MIIISPINIEIYAIRWPSWKYSKLFQMVFSMSNVKTDIQYNFRWRQNLIGKYVVKTNWNKPIVWVRWGRMPKASTLPEGIFALYTGGLYLCTSLQYSDELVKAWPGWLRRSRSCGGEGCTAGPAGQAAGTGCGRRSTRGLIGSRETGILHQEGIREGGREGLGRLAELGTHTQTQGSARPT